MPDSYSPPRRVTMKNPPRQNAIFLSFSGRPACYTPVRMTCPYCEAPIAPSAQECGNCHLTFSKTCALFGAGPRVHREVYDSTRQLTIAQQKEIQKHILRIRTKYPQLFVQVFLHSFPPPHPFRTQVFWLFNASGFSGDTRRGPNNHTLLIAIDPVRREASLMPGYGLEPFLDEETMTKLLDSAQTHWQRGDWPAGILSLLNTLDTHLETIAQPDDHKQYLPSEF